jgi:hypothetical protein
MFAGCLPASAFERSASLCVGNDVGKSKLDLGKRSPELRRPFTGMTRINPEWPKDEGLVLHQPLGTSPLFGYPLYTPETVTLPGGMLDSTAPSERTK